MSNPDLSITIPTYNRAQFLQHLLGSLARQISDLTHSYEIIICDNASPDDTEAVVNSYKDKLNIIYIKRAKNFGAADNRLELVKHARGTIQLNVSDDDDLILSEVDKNVTQMLSDPGINVLFAPWKIYNRSDDKMVSHAFYPQAKDMVLEKDDFETLLTFILDNHVFPEIYMIRTDFLQSVPMNAPTLAYWAFANTAEYLGRGKIAFNKTPYYTTITKHFEGENRQQLGYVEMLSAWDRYRGGLEYILARIPSKNITPEKSIRFLQQIQKFVATRINFALRLRIASKHDPVDTYYLTSRVRAMGYDNLIPMSFDDIRIQAAVHYFLFYFPTASDKFKQVVCVGKIPEPFLQHLKTRVEQPPVIAENFSVTQYSQALTLVPGSARDLKISPLTLAENQVRVIGVEDLMKKFA